MTSFYDLWQWEAHYLDGTVLPEYEQDGRRHHFYEIQQDRLDSIYYRNADPARAPVVMKWIVGRKLILFSRNLIRYAMGVVNPEKVRIWVVGYQDKDEKKMLAIMPDGAVIVIDDIDNLKVT